MQIFSVGSADFSVHNFSVSNNKQINPYFKTKSYPCDSVCFTANESKNTTKDNLIDALTVIGFVGVPLVSSIVIGAELMKRTPQGDQIFLSDGSYLCDVKDLQVKSDNVVADADDGILKIKNSPVNIEASKCDYADPERGVYWNYDGSVDIDLLNDKYIDTKNGIYVDVNNGLSAFVKDGVVRDLPLINFGGASMSAPNPPMTPYHISADIMEDGLMTSFTDKIKESINILFGTHIPTGYMIDENNNKVPMKEWLKEHDAFNRDFSAKSDVAQQLEGYVREHDLPVHFDGSGHLEAGSMSEFIESHSHDVDDESSDTVDDDNSTNDDAGFGDNDGFDDVEDFDF